MSVYQASLSLRIFWSAVLVEIERRLSSTMVGVLATSHNIDTV